MTQELQQRAQKIRLLLLDVDGVLTDGSLYYTGDGSEIKAFNTLDGHGIKLLQKSGVKVGIITGRKSVAVTNRAEKLGISLIIQGREDKYIAMQELLASHDFDLEEIAFMGDDYPDLTVMCRVGLALSVPNGHEEVRKRAHWVSEAKGGQGAVREACDFLMKSQGNFEKMLDEYILN